MRLDPLDPNILVRPGTWIDALRDRHPRLLTPIDRWNPRVDVCDGWRDLVCGLLADLEAMGLPELRITQVKEKFGLLRVYVNNGNETVAARIKMAVEVSAETCEACGAPGTLDHVGGWYGVRCSACRLRRRLGVEDVEPN